MPYTYTAVSTEDQTSIQAYAPGRGGTRVFRMEYRMNGYAQRYPDTGRVNQRIFSAENDYGQASFSVTLPGGDPVRIQPFVHGAVPQGKISLYESRLSIGPADLRPGDKVEVDLLFPAEWLSGAPILPSDMLEEALAIERAIASEAAEKAAKAAERRDGARTGLLAAVPAYAAAFAVVFFRQKRKYGLTRALPPTVDDALLDSIPPAMAEVLHAKTVSASGLSATLLDLTGRGVLAMRSEKDDTCFTRVDMDPPQGLVPHEAFLLSWLFPGQGERRISSLNAGEDYQAAQAFTHQYSQWKNTVTQDAVSAGWIFPNGTKKFLLAFSSAMLGLLLAVAMLGLGAAWPIPVLCAVLGVIFCLAFARARRLTDAGEERLAVIQGFLQNYEDRLTADPYGVAGRAPLVMALGYLTPMAEWIGSHLEAFARDAGADVPIWMYAGWYLSLYHMDTAIRGAQQHNEGVQDPRLSDGSGNAGGGGFSGGTNSGSSHGAW
ncbi:MAG: DUF2207 domain-containing protein [Firmicutes bacterium]|nr:DUF2207 domain-containing protein [Bacillota bacterium]